MVHATAARSRDGTLRRPCHQHYCSMARNSASQEWKAHIGLDLESSREDSLGEGVSLHLLSCVSNV